MVLIRAHVQTVREGDNTRVLSRRMAAAECGRGSRVQLELLEGGRVCFMRVIDALLPEKRAKQA